MDFVYDKLQAGAEESPSPEAVEHAEHPNSSIDKAADKLESNLEKTFEKVSNSQSWSSFWSNIKEKGTAAFQDLEKNMNAATATTSTDDESNQQTKDTSASSSSSNLEGSTETVKPDSNGGGNSTMMGELSLRAQAYIDNLDKDLEKIEVAAGSYLSNFGKDFKSLVKEAITVAAPNDTTYDVDPSKSPSIASDSGEDLPSEILFNVPEDIRNQIYSTRLDAQLHALHTSTEPFLTNKDEPGFNEFSETFDVNSRTDDIASDLEKYPKLRSLMETLVPHKVSYEQFWTKYYYMRNQLSEQEQKRKLLLSQTNNDESGEVSWDDEDDENDKPDSSNSNKSKDNAVKASNTTDSSRPSSDSSYDLVSKNSSSADLKTQETSNNYNNDTTNKTSKNPASNKGDGGDDDDDDDDWE